jgi:hypothetical protein
MRGSIAEWSAEAIGDHHVLKNKKGQAVTRMYPDIIIEPEIVGLYCVSILEVKRSQIQT